MGWACNLHVGGHTAENLADDVAERGKLCLPRLTREEQNVEHLPRRQGANLGAFGRLAGLLEAPDDPGVLPGSRHGGGHLQIHDQNEIAAHKRGIMTINSSTSGF